MDGQRRPDSRRELRAELVLKKYLRSGKRTDGVIRDISASADDHSRGIEVWLDDGQVGRVEAILREEPQDDAGGLRGTGWASHKRGLSGLALPSSLGRCGEPAESAFPKALPLRQPRA